MDDGMLEAQELAALMVKYQRLQARINEQCASFKRVHMAALAENLRRLSTDSERLAYALSRRIDLMGW